MITLFSWHGLDAARRSFRTERPGFILRVFFVRRAAQRGISLRECYFRGAHLTWIYALLLLSLVYSGCGAARPNKYYQLTIPSEAAADPPGDALPITLLLGPIQASHLYREDHIVYSSGAENMGTYEYQRWAEPPTEMIEEVLFRTLRSSGRYRQVYLLHSNLHGDYLLHGHLYDFKELTGSTVSARLALELELRDIKSGNTVWSHLYSHDEPTKGKDVAAVVAALNHNVQRAAAEFQAQLSQYFAAHPIPKAEP